MGNGPLSRRAVLCAAAAAMTLPRRLFTQGGGATFEGTRAGDLRDVHGVYLCWCPAGRFVMGSPPGEPERRPGEDQVTVTLTRGFWMAQYEATQALWRRVMGALPAPPTAELPEEDDLPVGNVNFGETEAFCRRLTADARTSGDLPTDWEYRLPTEAQWEYACRAGTRTATAFGDSLGHDQANFRGRRSRSVPCTRHGHEKRARRHLARAAWRLLGRRRVGVSLCLPTEIRTRPTLRPHWVPNCRCENVAHGPTSCSASARSSADGPDARDGKTQVAQAARECAGNGSLGTLRVRLRRERVPMRTHAGRSPEQRQSSSPRVKSVGDGPGLSVDCVPSRS